MDQAPARDGVRRTTHRHARTPLRTGLRVFALGALVALVIVVASLVVLAPLTAGQRRARQVDRSDLVIQRHAAALRATLVRWQEFLEPKLDDYQAGGSKYAPADIARGSELTKNQISEATELTTRLRGRNVAGEARDLDDAMSGLTA